MKFSAFKPFLRVALILSTAFALWAWFRPFEWSPDPAALCEVQGVNLTLDHSFFWVEPFLKVNAGASHDLSKPVFLMTSQGRRLEPADTTFASPDGKETREIWLKFWLDSKDIAGPLDLHLNGGKLRLKTRPGIPTKSKYHTSNRW
jgi:hypothetical protein